MLNDWEGRAFTAYGAEITATFCCCKQPFGHPGCVKSLDAGGYVKRQRFLFDSSRRAGTKLGSDLARCRRRRCHRSLHAALLSPHQSPDTDPPDKKIEKDYSSCSAIPHPFNGVSDFSS